MSFKATYLCPHNLTQLKSFNPEKHTTKWLASPFKIPKTKDEQSPIIYKDIRQVQQQLNYTKAQPLLFKKKKIIISSTVQIVTNSKNQHGKRKFYFLPKDVVSPC